MMYSIQPQLLPRFLRTLRRKLLQTSARSTWCQKVYQKRLSPSLCSSKLYYQSHGRAFSSETVGRPKSEVRQRVYWRGNPNDIKIPGVELMYAEQENEHFHQVLERIPEYRKKLLYRTPNTEISNHDHQDGEWEILQSLDNLPVNMLTQLSLLETLSSLSTKTRSNLLVDSRFQSLCLSVLSNLFDLPEKEYFSLLEILSRFCFRSAIYGAARDFRLLVYQKTSEECVRRYQGNSWDVEQLFLAADFNFATRTSAFPSAAIFRHLQNEIKKQFNHLSKVDLVLFMYHCCVSRRMNPNLVPLVMETVLQNLNSGTLVFDEVAIICLGLFKTNTPIHLSELLVKLTKNVEKEMFNASSMALAAVFKALTKSVDKNTSRYNRSFQKTLGPLLEKSTLALPNVEFHGLINIVRYFVNIHLMSEAFLTELVRTILQDDVSKWRVKEVARFLFLFCNFSCFSDNPQFKVVVQRLLEELRTSFRLSELQIFPESLVQSLVGLSLVDVYDQRLTNLLFRDDFQELLSRKRKSLKEVNYMRDLFQLDHSIRIDRPDYHGNRLQASVKHMSDIPLKSRKPVTQSSSIRDVLMKELHEELVSVMGGQQFIQPDHLLPHYHTPDVEIRLDGNGKPVPVKQWRTSCTTTQNSQDDRSPEYLHSLLLDLTKASREERAERQQRLAVVMFGPNSYHVYRHRAGNTSKQLLGLHQMKVRHLQRSGFTVIEIPYFKFNQAADRKRFLQKKIEESQEPNK